MKPGIPFCQSEKTYGFNLCLVVIAMMLTACYSGQPVEQTSKGKSSDRTIRLDTFRLSQITIPTNLAYSSLLDCLDRNDLQNIDRALIVFSNNKADSLSRDSMLISFNEFMDNVIQEFYAGKLIGNRKLMDQFENKEDQSEAKKMTALLAAHGISLSYREGDFFLEPDLDFVYSHLDGVLTSGSRSYLQTRISLSKGFVNENNQPVSPPDSLAHQVVAWENFILTYPGYAFKDEILALYIDVLAAYLSGLDQLPLYDPSTKILNQEYQTSYLHYMEKYPKLESTKTIKKFYDLLASKGFKYDESLDSFLSELNFIPTQNPQ